MGQTVFSQPADEVIQAGTYEFVELYPVEGHRVHDNHGQAIFALGTKASLTLPANSCQVLELRRATQADPPLVAAIDPQPAAETGYPRALDHWTTLDGRLFAFP